MSTGGRPLRVAVVEDEAMLRGLLQALLAGQPGIDVVATAAGHEEALREVRPGEVDVAVLDIDLGDGNGIALGRSLQQRDPRLRILLISNYNMLALVRSISADAPTPWSYLSKRSSAQPGELVRVLAAVARGQVVIDPALVDRSVAMVDTPLARLSAAQFRVLQLVAQGQSNDTVAQALDISPKAVEAHLSHIYKLLDLPPGANNRVAAVLAFLQQSVRPEP
ncbi:response regulator transcription factor [Cellulomonas xiejunii]|uniref:Response regulator transcription factor n=1 Tax=Cellulomonas xiejunii TaxID=2968083 RepID=A0ABY5KMH2_9CELL|nr:response regulator transcription factor [Cellulomonas xiejunii]MCC2313711.1 response regulator transcription factor [Cellulomonas xiejunii]MCC2321078.1 response regulator transcription factor [Cellulomonas xiejunii]UUI71671.1 response regulator transcription factor [Cellulomonas xiejunii]